MLKPTYILAAALLLPLLAFGGEAEEEAKERCKRHRDAIKKPFTSSCGQQQAADEINTAAKETLQVCHEASQQIAANKAEIRALVEEEAKSTADVQQLQAKIKSGEIKVDAGTGAFTQIGAANETLVNSFRARTSRTKSVLLDQLKMYKKAHEREKKYGELANKYNTVGGNEEHSCPDSDSRYFYAQIIWLDGEITHLRKTLGKNVQAMNELYQKSMISLGASQQQAVAIAQATMATQQVQVREDGSLVGVKGSIWDGITGGPSPHDTTIGKVPCPEGTEGSACYDFVPKARTSVVGDQELDALTGVYRPGSTVGTLDPERRPADDGTAQPPAGAATGALSSVLTTPNLPQEKMTAQDWAAYDARKNELGVNTPAAISAERWTELSANPSLAPALQSVGSDTVKVQQYQMAVNDALNSISGGAAYGDDNYRGPSVFPDGIMGQRTKSATDYLMQTEEGQKALAEALKARGLR